MLTLAVGLGSAVTVIASIVESRRLQHLGPPAWPLVGEYRLCGPRGVTDGVMQGIRFKHPKSVVCGDGAGRSSSIMVSILASIYMN
jgi:hypothetical protein